MLAIVINVNVTKNGTKEASSSCSNVTSSRASEDPVPSTSSGTPNPVSPNVSPANTSSRAPELEDPVPSPSTSRGTVENEKTEKGDDLVINNDSVNNIVTTPSILVVAAAAAGAAGEPSSEDPALWGGDDG